MKVTILGSGSSGGVPLIGNYWGNCNPDNIKNNRTRVSIVVNIDNYNFSEEILANRKLLIEGMRKHGFKTIRTEWWHYGYQKNWQYPVLNEPLPCSN